MRWGRAAVVLSVALSAIAANEVAPSKAELAALYQKAEKELGAGHYAAALQELDAIEARQPGLAAVQNFRGVVLLRRGEDDRAQTALQKALAIDPQLWSARFNLANIPFLRKDWAEAGRRFAALRDAVRSEDADSIAPLLDYKLLLTVLFEKEDEKIGAILSKLKSAEQSPAFDYAEAALAFHRGKRNEGKDWIATAEKDYPPRENKLFRETFYEVGWLTRPKSEAPILARLTTSGETAAAAPPEAQADREQAKIAFEAHDSENALKLLDRAEESSPADASAIRLRARILLEQGKFNEAEAALNNATSADQAAWETHFLRARISLGRKNYADARAQLKTLLMGKSGILRPETVQLIRYQLFLIFLQEGRESAAQQTMDQFKITDQTPALYYAQAAWNFRHNNPKQAQQWIDSAKKLFSEQANSEFANTLADLGASDKEAVNPVAASSPSQPALASPAPSQSAPPHVGANEQHKAISAPAAGTVAKSQGKKKEKRAQPQKKKSASAKSRTRRAAASAAAATPPRASVPTPVPTAVPTPRPAFLNRLARTLLHTLERPSPKTEGSQTHPSAGTKPAKPTPTPAGRHRPEN